MNAFNFQNKKYYMKERSCVFLYEDSKGNLY